MAVIDIIALASLGIGLAMFVMAFFYTTKDPVVKNRK